MTCKRRGPVPSTPTVRWCNSYTHAFSRPARSLRGGGERETLDCFCRQLQQWVCECESVPRARYQRVKSACDRMCAIRGRWAPPQPPLPKVHTNNSLAFPLEYVSHYILVRRGRWLLHKCGSSKQFFISLFRDRFVIRNVSRWSRCFFSVASTYIICARCSAFRVHSVSVGLYI